MDLLHGTKTDPSFPASPDKAAAAVKN
jgi:carboxyl-terminal processing protease